VTQQEKDRGDGAVRLDLLGLVCPEPITRLQEAAADRPGGTVIELEADDGGIQWDLPAWCIGRVTPCSTWRNQRESGGGRCGWGAAVSLTRRPVLLQLLGIEDLEGDPPVQDPPFLGVVVGHRLTLSIPVDGEAVESQFGDVG